MCMTVDTQGQVIQSACQYGNDHQIWTLANGPSGTKRLLNYLGGYGSCLTAGWTDPNKLFTYTCDYTSEDQMWGMTE